MTNRNKDEASRLIENFLIENPKPQTSDWKRLIDAHPEHAGDIADAALVYGGTDEVAEGAQPPFNDALFNATISRVLNLVHQTPSPSLEAAQRKVAEILGPEAKKVAIEIGIGPYASLLSGVLVGRTSAPSRIIAALGRRLDVPLAALSEVFRRTFAMSEVPAFKSPDSQPRLMAKPSTWQQAVKAMKLPVEETERLLKLCDEE
jgi:hypothetical protein